MAGELVAGLSRVPVRAVRGVHGVGRRANAALRRAMLRRRIAWETWFRLGRHHRAEIDPFHLLRVDPEKLHHLMDLTSDQFRRERWDVRDGDWDLELPRLKEDLQFASLMAHWRDGVAWEETPFLQDVIQRVDRGERFWHGCASRDEVRKRCERLDGLYLQSPRKGTVPNGS